MEKWDVVIYFLLIGGLLFVGKILKTRFLFLNRIVLPTALLGGLIGLLLSDVIIPGSFHIDVETMTAIVYHALALGFISLTLKQGESKNKRKVWTTGMMISSTYALQGFLGILLVLIFFSDKFVGAGMLLPLGFGQGPGLAISFGNMWNAMLNNQGGALGASYAFLGFVFGGTVGVLLINLLSRKRGIDKPTQYSDVSQQTTQISIDTVKEVSVVDGLTTQIVIISIIYALVWLTLTLLEMVLTPLGTIGNTVFGLLEGFNFIIGIFYALIYKLIFKAIQSHGKNVNFMKNDYILSNISSLCFNFMIAGSVLTITIDFLADYGVLLLVIALIGGVSTLFYLNFLVRRVYSQFKDEYFIALFGMLTGVASTGIALLKGIDRDLETPVAEELVLGSGTAITMAIPLFVFLMLPQIGYGQTYAKWMDFIALIGCLMYVVVIVTILMIRTKRKPV
ncbi:MAG: hypothetical protein GX582_02265 [Acholeplasmataceae bacterium]|nr:hypothetical protein [Acholeplasmataceae bacterium]